MSKIMLIGVVLFSMLVAITSCDADESRSRSQGCGRKAPAALPTTLAPSHPYTLGLMQSVPRLDMPRDRELHVIDGLPPNLARLPQGCYFHPRCELADDRCRRETPEMVEIGEEHSTACFRWSEVKK